MTKYTQNKKVNLKKFRVIIQGKSIKKTLKTKIFRIVKAPSRKIKKNANEKSTLLNNITKIFNIKTKEEMNYYYEAEKVKSIISYGREILSNLKEMDQNYNIPLDFLKQKGIDPFFRSKFIEWIIICLKSCQDDQIFFLFVYIFDNYLSKCTETDFSFQNLVLISKTCIYIAAKFEKSCVYGILPDNFLNEEKTKEKEVEIDICLDFNFEAISAFDFIQVFFSDVFAQIRQGNLSNIYLVHFEKLEKISILLSKIVTIDESFYEFKFYMIAAECIKYACLILLNGTTDINKEVKSFLIAWTIEIVFKDFDKNSEELKRLEEKVERAYINFTKSPISREINFSI